MVNFSVSEADAALIEQIVDRFERVVDERVGTSVDRLTVTMDLTACHANGNALRLADLLSADDFNLIHDVSGIGRHIDTETGGLMNCFRPRYSAPLSEKSLAVLRDANRAAAEQVTAV